jgi:L-asparaginase II
VSGLGPLAEVTRRDVRRDLELSESTHQGSLAVCDLDGEVLASLGDPARSTFVRSCAKPFQATACLELLDLSGSTPTDVEVAVAWASHRGERQHIEAVRRLLSRSATTADQLTTPPDRPEADPGATPAPILHNCSGKHALFALTGTEQACPRERLLDADGPLQRPVLAVLEEALGPLEAVGVDGCGAPAVAVPLSRLARAYAALASEDRWRRVREAGLAHPRMVGGIDRLESALLGVGVVAKVGAEGVFAAGWVDERGRARGLAVKAEDGAPRAATAATVELLEAIGVVRRDLWRPAAPLGGGRPVGRVQAAPAVLDLATSLL